MQERTRRRFTITICMLALFAGALSAQDKPKPDGAPCPQPNPTIDNFKHRENTATAPLGRLGHVEARGHGPIPLVLIPGAPFDWSVWESFMQRNADRFTMYAVTPAGYGGTAPPPIDEPIDDFSRRAWTRGVCSAIAELIRTERLDRPILVGHHYLSDTYALRVAILAGRGATLFPSIRRSADEPIRNATPEERVKAVNTFIAPMYRAVDDTMWAQGVFAAATLCRDPKRAAELHRVQLEVPIPTQIRYMLEYQTEDVTSELGRLTCPVLIIKPKRNPVTLDEMLETYRDLYIASYGSIEAARETWTRQLKGMWGDLDTGVRKFFDPASQWEELAAEHPRLRVEYVGDTRTFIMEDQPEELDRLLGEFAQAASVPAGK